MPRIVTTPIAPLVLPESRLAPRRLAPDVVAAALPGPACDRLAAGNGPGGPTGPQPGPFPGPLHTLSKAPWPVPPARGPHPGRRGARRARVPAGGGGRAARPREE